MRENLILIRSLTFRCFSVNRSGVRELGSFNNCTSKRILDVLKPG